MTGSYSPKNNQTENLTTLGNKSLSPRGSFDSRVLNKLVPALLPEEEISEELQSLLDDRSVALTADDLVILRSFEQKGLDFESPQCPKCNEGNPFLFRVNGNSSFCCSCGYYREGEA